MLTVVSVAYPLAPVTPDPAGGAEQVLAQLDRALVDAGHRSIVIAPNASRVAGELAAIPAAPARIDHADHVAAHWAVRGTLDRLLRRERVNLVHMHGIDYADYLPIPGVPVLATLHMPLEWYGRAALAPDRPGTWLVPVSASQAHRAPAHARLLSPIDNGVDETAYRPASIKRRHAVMVGRVSPEKGFHHAMEAAARARVPLIAAGKLFPYAEHLRYFAEEVRPRLDSSRRFIGPVSGPAKRRLLAGALCVLIPSNAPETSSLVAMEALASGTPVIAYRSGALPDIVQDGVTGFLVDDVRGMADAIGRVDTIDPARCRQAACERFSLRRTTDAYLDLYQRLAA